ncbi:MAG: GspE/PulE/PilB domain-containing protein [Myxococcaceae bacterium]
MQTQSRSRLGEILVKAKIIDELQLRSALARQDQWGGRITTTIVEMGFQDEDTVYSALARALKVELMHLGTVNKDAQALAKFDASYAEEKGIFPVSLKDNGKSLILAMADPTDLETVDEAGRRSRARVTVVIASETEIRHAIMRHYRNIDPGAGATGRARKAVQEAGTPTSGDDDDFKITDMSGRTVMKRLSDIVDPNAPKAPPPASVAAPGQGSAADMLDEMMAAPAAASPTFTEDELKRIEAVRTNQEKSARVMQALTDLLIEKGLMRR